MSKKEEEKDDVQVYVDGKLVSFNDLEKRYPQISIGHVESNKKIVEALKQAKKPLTAEGIAKSSGLSVGTARIVLKGLVKKRFALEFRLGGRTYNYLLTADGLRMSETI